MRLKTIATLALSLVCAVPLAACSNPVGGDAAPAGDAFPQSVSYDALKGRHITVWHANTLPPAYKNLFRAFEAKTGATVEEVVFPDPYESNLMTKWSTGAHPDLMVFQSVTSAVRKLNPAKNLWDLTDQDFTGKAKFGLNKYSAVVDGKNYGLPLEVPTVQGLWYNKELFAKWGLKPPTNLTELKTTCAAIKEKDPSISTLFDVGGDQWPTQILPFMLWADPLKDGLQDKLNTGQAQWTDPKIVDSFKAYKDLMDEGCFNKNLKTATYADQEKAFTTGQTAMIAQGTSVSADFVKLVGVEKMNQMMGWQALSLDKPTAAWAVAMTLMLPKTGDTEKSETALALMKFAATDGYQQFVETQGQEPTLEGFTTPATVPDALKSAYAALEGSSSSPRLLVADFGPLTTYMSELINGSKTPEQVAADVQGSWLKSAKAQGLSGF